jgi:hypothetical protein
MKTGISLEPKFLSTFLPNVVTKIVLKHVLFVFRIYHQMIFGQSSRTQNFSVNIYFKIVNVEFGNVT